MSTKVVTDRVRLNFPKLFTPVASKLNPEGPKKYSTMILIPKTDTETMAKLRAAEAEALENGKHKFRGNKVPKNPYSIIKDGDEKEDADEYPEYAGHWYMSVNASEEYPPPVVNRRRETVIDRAEVYSGVYAKVSVTAFAFDGGEKKGVSFGLNAVQILGGGDRLGGGGVDVDKEFSDEGDDEESVI